MLNSAARIDLFHNHAVASAKIGDNITGLELAHAAFLSSCSAADWATWRMPRFAFVPFVSSCEPKEARPRIKSGVTGGRAGLLIALRPARHSWAAL